MTDATEIVRVVIDDIRNHPDDAFYLRSSRAALLWLEENRDTHIMELWLDHDLGSAEVVDDTIRPVVRYLEERCFLDAPVSIGILYVHTANPVGAQFITSSNLLKAHYCIVRSSMPTTPKE